MSERGASWRAKLLLLLAGCATGLVSAELLIRAIGAAPAIATFQAGQFQLSRNERIGWEPIPNPESAGDSLDPRWSEAQRNSMGYRDYEHSRAKLPGLYRIAVLGDSVAKGFGTDAHEATFPSVLESRLRAAGVRCEVMNFGVEGYNTQQEVETLRDRGLAYAPDLVVLAYVLNDRTYPAHELYTQMLQQETRTGRVSRTRFAPLLGWSALYRFLRFRAWNSLVGRGPAGDDARIRRLVGTVEQDTVEEYFGVLRELQRRHGFEVLVVVFPYLRLQWGYNFRAEHAWVARQSSRNEFRHLDLLDTMIECLQRSSTPIAHDAVHPTAAGLECAAARTARFLVESDIPGLRRP